MTIKRNISISEEIISYLLYLRTKIMAFLIYRRTFRNYISVVTHILRRQYPVEAILRNGSHISLHNHLQVSSIGNSQARNGVEYDTLNDTATFSSLPYVVDKNMKVTLRHAVTNGDAVSILLDNVYKFLPVEGRTVIDAGVNIGDSPIYFALRGAEKVIGLEPFPKIYEIARKNIELNNVSHKVTMMLGGCAAESGYTTIDPDLTSGIDTPLVLEQKRGKRVPLLTLEDILNQNNIPASGTILKMDCEGCEYQTILSASEDTLQKFSHILIEYHHGYKNLKEKLEKSHFSVSVTRPRINPRDVKSYVRIGYIYAKQN
jgi:FkbM family methyltransferase